MKVRPSFGGRRAKSSRQQAITPRVAETSRGGAPSLGNDALPLLQRPAALQAAKPSTQADAQSYDCVSAPLLSNETTTMLVGDLARRTIKNRLRHSTYRPDPLALLDKSLEAAPTNQSRGTMKAGAVIARSNGPWKLITRRKSPVPVLVARRRGAETMSEAKSEEQ